MQILLGEIMQQHADPNSPEYNMCDSGPCHWCEQAATLMPPNAPHERTPEQ